MLTYFFATQFSTVSLLTDLLLVAVYRHSPRVCPPLISFECLNHFALATLLYLAQFLSIPKLLTSFYNFGCFAFGVAERRVDADVFSVPTELRSVNMAETSRSCDITALSWVVCLLRNAGKLLQSWPTSRPHSDLLPAAWKPNCSLACR